MPGQPSMLAPLVVSHNRLPRANPFAVLYRSDLDGLCSDLEAGKLSGRAAAEALREALRRMDEGPELTDAGGVEESPLLIPSMEKLQQALVVLAVPPEVSIGRESVEKSTLPVSLERLRASLAAVRGEARISAVESVLRSCWAGLGQTSVAKLAQALASPAESRGDIFWMLIDRSGGHPLGITASDSDKVSLKIGEVGVGLLVCQSQP